MKRVVALDLSMNAGWAFFLEGSLRRYGLVQATSRPEDFPTSYPKNYPPCIEEHISNILSVVLGCKPDTIVVEETVPGRETYSQKILEFLHYCLITTLMNHLYYTDVKIVYVRTGEWRKTVELRMTKEDKKGNLKKNRERAKVKATELRKQIKKLGSKKANKNKVLDLKKELTTLHTSKLTRKHLSVRKANELFNLNFLQKDNDVADAILVGLAYLKGAKHADGKRPSKKK